MKKNTQVSIELRVNLDWLKFGLVNDHHMIITNVTYVAFAFTQYSKK
jgi:hypothetical protein